MSPVNVNAEQLLPSELQEQKPNDTCSLTINTQAQAQLIQLLTNLYKNPVTSMVREIIANAIDATRLLPVAQRQPIEIHLPSKTEPFFAVTDHALGMSTQEVKDIYLHYGTSTKTNNRKQIGSYGIGAKAPLSYTQTFMVTTVKNQQETTCLINLQQVQLYTKKTTATNGTRVKIPLPQNLPAHSFNEEQLRFYRAVKTYALLPIPGIQLTGLKTVTQEFHPYGEVIPCGTIQVAQQTLPVYWHSTTTNQDAKISGRQFFSSFERLYTLLYRDYQSQLMISKYDNFAISAMIGGFTYPVSVPVMSDSPSDEFIIELQPGIVNFSSSRDEIVPDAKKQQLLEDFCEQISTSFFNTIKTIGLRKMVNTDMFPWAILACASFHLWRRDSVTVDPLLIKQLFTNQQHVNLWEVTPRPLALLDLQDNQKSEIEFTIAALQNRQQLLQVVQKRFDDPQQRPSLFTITFNRNLVRNWDEAQWDKFCAESVINVFTDLNDFNLVKRILRKRKKIMKATQKKSQSTGSSTILLLFQEPQAQVQPVIEQILGGIPITINYYSRPQTEQLLEQFKPVKKNTLQSLQPLRSQIVDNALDFYQLCCSFAHCEQFVTPGFDLTLGLIVDNQPVTEMMSQFGEEILKTIFLFQNKIKLQVNVYWGPDLRSYNMKQVQQQNDLVLCLHDFSTKNLQHYLSQFTLPPRSITLSNHTPDLLLLLLYWSQILEPQPTVLANYEFIRPTLEKLLQLQLLRYDPQRLDSFLKETLFVLSKKNKNSIDNSSHFTKFPYRPLTRILNDFEPLYQEFNKILQTHKLSVQSINNAQVQADIQLVQQYWHQVQEQELHHNSAPLLDFNAYIVHSYLTK